MQAELQVGERAPTVTATAASGLWLGRAPFRSETYGKVRGVSPVNAPETKVVVYTRTLAAPFWALATALDKELGQHPRLRWSFVQVLDPKGAQYGGYTAAELERRLGELRQQTQRNHLSRLSVLVSATNAASLGPRLGLTAENDILVARLAGNRVEWVQTLRSAALDPAAIAALLPALIGAN